MIFTLKIKLPHLSDPLYLKMFLQNFFFFFFLVATLRISTGMKVMHLTEVIINWHEEILHLFSEVLSSLLQLLLCFLSFSATLSLLGFQSFHYGIQNTSFTRILARIEKQAARIMSGYAFLYIKQSFMDHAMSALQVKQTFPANIYFS